MTTLTPAERREIAEAMARAIDKQFESYVTQRQAMDWKSVPLDQAFAALSALEALGYEIVRAK